MDESKITITPDFSKFFKAWVTINITSVYTNMVSFYEVASKLIVNLNNLKKAQNNSSDQMDSMVSQTEEYITYVRNYLTSWSANIHTEWDNFWQDRNEYEQAFLTKLKETYDNFIKELKQIESNFLEEIKAYWSEKTPIIENTAENAMNDLIAIYNKYKDKVDTWNTGVTSDVTNAINDTKELMEQLQNKLTTFEAEQKAIINSKNTEWKNLANNFYNEYKDVAGDLIDNTDLLEFVKTWGKNNPEKFDKYPLLTFIKYTGTETPQNPINGDLWLKNYSADSGSLDNVLWVNCNYIMKYNGSSWEQITPDNRLYYTNDNKIYCYSISLNEDSRAINTTLDVAKYGAIDILGYSYEDISVRVEESKMLSMNFPYLATREKINSMGIIPHPLFPFRTTVSGCAADKGFGTNNYTYYSLMGYAKTHLDENGNEDGVVNNNFYRSDGGIHLQPDNCQASQLMPHTLPSGYQFVTGLYPMNFDLIYNSSTNTYAIYVSETQHYNLPVGAIPCFTNNALLYYILNGTLYSMTRLNGTTNTIISGLENERLYISPNADYVFSTKTVYKPTLLTGTKEIIFAEQNTNDTCTYNNDFYITYSNDTKTGLAVYLPNTSIRKTFTFNSENEVFGFGGVIFNVLLGTPTNGFTVNTNFPYLSVEEIGYIPNV